MATKSEAYKSLELGASGSPIALVKLSWIWERTILKNEKLLVSSTKSDPITMFHGSKAPNMSVTQYVERIFKYSHCSPSCFVIAQIYMDTFLHKTGGFLTSFNAHRLLITSVMVAAKFLDDKYYSNAYYAKVGGVSTEEMNKMEIELFVTRDLFLKYCEKLDRAVELLKNGSSER
ncbi:Cyclin-P3-1, partial [Mucuna pruriens]